MTTRLDAWLALTEEDPIEPDMPILDPHHHFWERPGDVYLLDNLLADTGSGHRVNQTVFVECHSMYRTDGPEEMRSVGEVEFVEGIAAANALRQAQGDGGGLVQGGSAGQAQGDGGGQAQGGIGGTAVAAGIVGNADLMLGDAVAPVLEALAEAGKGRFKGIRCTAAWDASPEITTARANSERMLANPEFRRGLACLERMGLSFDCIVYHPQLAEVADMARAFPALTIILNHVGRPLGIGPYADRREELMPEWRAGIDAVAECPNVVMKVGGLGNPISGFDWHQRPFPPGSREIAASGAPYYLYSIEKFSPARCMFESNFPVDKQSCSYTVCWNAFKRLARDFSATEQADLFHNTAARAYRLPEV